MDNYQINNVGATSTQKRLTVHYANIKLFDEIKQIESVVVFEQLNLTNCYKLFQVLRWKFCELILSRLHK